MILLVTELVLLTSVLSVTVISRHNTILNVVAQYPARYPLYTRACKAGHVVEVTHTLLVTSINAVTLVWGSLRLAPINLLNAPPFSPHKIPCCY